MDRSAAILAFETLASPVRLDAFLLLVRHEPTGLVAGEISSRLGLPATNLSFHLKALCHAGLLTCTPEGRYLRYRARTAMATDLVNFLTRECCNSQCSFPQADAVPLPHSNEIGT